MKNKYMMSGKGFYKKLILVFMCSMLVISTTQAGHVTPPNKSKSSDISMNLVGTFGKKLLDSSWQEFDNQYSLGASFDFKQRGWPFSLAIATILSADVESNNSSAIEEEAGYTGEIHVGIRKIFHINNSQFEPFVGGGIAFMTASLDRRVNSSFFVTTDDDDAVGYWLGTGFYLHMTKRLTLGLDVRYSEAEVTLFGTNREAGGLHFNTVVGAHW